MQSAVLRVRFGLLIKREGKIVGANLPPSPLNRRFSRATPDKSADKLVFALSRRLAAAAP
ncbi:MAG: hypothetical protein JXR49_19430 [Acidobacteria bacterium]|nr:hypothetical protein [Acidobacteriota bacterium]